MGLKRIVLEILGGGQQSLTPGDQPLRTCAFDETPFTAMTIIGREGDHVDVEQDGAIVRYAIGHLPSTVQQAFSANSRLEANLAGPARRTILGILAEEAIADLHDDDPLICPVAMNIIRKHSANPDHALACYRRSALRIGELHGRETEDATGAISMIYHASDRRLTIEITRLGWRIERDAIVVADMLPTTVAVAAIGRPVATLVDHHAFQNTDAVVTGVSTGMWGTRITFAAKPIHLVDIEVVKAVQES